MYKSSLENFRQEVKRIREYIKHIQYVDDIARYTALETGSEQIKTLLNDLKEHLKDFGVDKKVFEYKASIISLYGILEKYVEIWIKEYLDILSDTVPEYNQIDERIREQHFKLSLNLMLTITDGRNLKYQNINREEVLKALNNCMENPSSYQFNTEAFVLLSGNLKHNKIVELLSPLNIDLNDRFKKNETFASYLKSEKQKENIGNIGTDLLYEKVNDLVERRNEIAHGSEVTDILGHSVLEGYIQFLENYCQAIFEILSEEIIKYESVYKFIKIDDVDIIHIFNNKILAFKIENHDIKVGDVVIVETAKGRFSKKAVLEIQVNNESYQKIAIKEKTKVAIRVEPPIKKNQKFFIIK